MKLQWKYALSFLTVLAVMALFVILLVDQYTTSTWVCLGSMAFAYLCVAVVGFRRRPGRDAEIHAATATYVVGMFFAANLLVNAPIIATGFSSESTVVLVNAVLIGVFVVVSLVVSVGADKSAADSAMLEADSRFVRGLVDTLESLAQSSRDEVLSRRLIGIAEKAKYSPIQSTPSAEGVELRILEHIRSLEVGAGGLDAATTNVTLAQIESLLALRVRLIQSEQ